MFKQKLIKKAIVGVGCVSILLSSSFLMSNIRVQASTNQGVNLQAITSSSTQKKADKIIASAQSSIGKVKYKFGANDPKQLLFDCSAFTKYIFAKQGINLKSGSTAQSKQGIYIARKNLQKGDLIFFSVSKAGKINHVGIYMGNGKFIHNTTGSTNGVTIGNLNLADYQKRYITARRVL
ncbi:NlpC/P60 family protein [Paenibacillus psychroresistens]|uniref:NlpC/P60 family protein n=1 Tax=Paenibacillus psychroresistens TaxID=1778678 RepID=A0A6B8RSU7_9BACL|nr:C40 family peptidase [Paenibacillus psychroresistens]QGQ98987.1 NlpC/P60 family protein [Paenibacillus psychroresistens]